VTPTSWLARGCEVRHDASRTGWWVTVRSSLPSRVDWQRAAIQIAGIHLCSFGRRALRRSASADLHLLSSRSGPAVKSGPTGPSEASREAALSYGGGVVKGVALIAPPVVAGLWWAGMWLRLAGRSGRPRGSRRSVNLICGGWVPQDLVSSHVRCLDSSAAPRGGLLKGRARTGVRECREARAASPAATGCRVGEVQAAAALPPAASLGSCFGGTEGDCARVSPAGTDASGTESG
jgi:hypothetical protein